MSIKFANVLFWRVLQPDSRAGIFGSMLAGNPPKSVGSDLIFVGLLSHLSPHLNKGRQTSCKVLLQIAAVLSILNKIIHYGRVGQC